MHGRSGTWVLPDFFFHISIARIILRHLGANLGKRDYLGNLRSRAAATTREKLFA
jgi:hypothetical protein